MKTNQRQILIAILVFVLAFSVRAVVAQSLTIKGRISIEGKSTIEPIVIKVIDLNSNEVKTIQVIKAFKYVLPYNGEYSIVISAGDKYRPKMIYINTNTPSQEPYKYQFDVNLEQRETAENIPNAVGGIFWHKRDKEFTYYLIN